MRTPGAAAYRMEVSELAELPRVRQWIHAWTLRNGLPAEAANRLDVCSTELLTNIVSHGYDDLGGACRIVLTLRREGDVLSLEIEDDGRPFNPLEAEAPPRATRLEDAGVGGWGIPIVRGVSDGLRYQRADGRNRVTVLQRCPATEPP